MANAGNIYKDESTWKIFQSGKRPETKFSKMHYWSGILTDHRNKPKDKLAAMKAMIAAQDSDTRDHLRAALTQVLRDEKNTKVRHEAIEQLGIYFSWSEIEWTWFLHYKRRPEDTETLTVYEWYAQHKTLNRLDVNLLNRGIRELAD